MTDTSMPIAPRDSDGGPEAAVSHQRPLRCLLVEDSRFDRSLVRYSAERAGVEIDFVDVATMAEAHESLNAEDFELIILDRRLPDGDGLDLPSQIAGTARNAGVPTIMLSGGDADELAPASARAGCVGFISKNDLSPEGLAAAVRSAVVQQIGEGGTMGDGASDELRVLLGAFSDVSRAARMEPLTRRLMTVVSELRQSLAGADAGPDALAAVEEISELTLMLWLELDGGDRKQPVARAFGQDRTG